MSIYVQRLAQVQKEEKEEYDNLLLELRKLETKLNIKDMFIEEKEVTEIVYTYRHKKDKRALFYDLCRKNAEIKQNNLNNIKLRIEELSKQTPKAKPKPKKRKVTARDKKIVVARQKFTCANTLNSNIVEKYECPYWLRGGDGRFDESGYDIDHIVEFVDTEDDRLENLQALCKCCHLVKTARFNSKKRKSK